MTKETEDTKTKTPLSQSGLKELLFCAFCGAKARVCEELEKDDFKFFGWCEGHECGITTPFQETEDDVMAILKRRAK